MYKSNFSQHYKVIGQELSGFDCASRYSYDLLPAFTEFREGVAFVPVEVLESYLEDLLDPNKSCQELSIVDAACLRRRLALPLIGLAFVVACGIHFAGQGVAIPAALGITLISAVPFGAMLHLAVTYDSRRRMKFAQVVSREIARRRGEDRDGRGMTRSQLMFGEFFRQHPGQQQSAAKVTIH